MGSIYLVQWLSGANNIATDHRNKEEHEHSPFGKGKQAIVSDRARTTTTTEKPIAKCGVQVWQSRHCFLRVGPDLSEMNGPFLTDCRLAAVAECYVCW